MISWWTFASFLGAITATSSNGGQKIEGEGERKEKEVERDTNKREEKGLAKIKPEINNKEEEELIPMYIEDR